VVRTPGHPGWSDTLAARVRHHFDLFGLGALYGAQGATLLSGIAYSVAREFEAGGETDVRRYLRASEAAVGEHGEHAPDSHGIHATLSGQESCWRATCNSSAAGRATFGPSEAHWASTERYC
jgi:hypothetical protein